MSQAGMLPQHCGSREGSGCGCVARGAVPSTVRTPHRTARVLLLQAVEARSQDEGTEPKAGQQVRGWGAPSAEPWAAPGCPVPPVSAVRVDPGMSGSGQRRLRACGVLGRKSPLQWDLSGCTGVPCPP